ncbi:MAG: glycoside hydrolase family 99-like domain-containing protein [Acidimicrobiales bacterium]
MRYLAFYLPQFHPTPENDVWWGRGFTEWRNVAQARPLFTGHDQPRIPADLGFYDLRLPEVRAAQAALARAHGIDGFVYYHYWFAGRRLLDRPFAEVLESGTPSLPFALCWANEPWTRTWSGRGSSYLMAQTYSAEDDIAHAQWMSTAFADERYIRVGERPLLLVYNMAALPDPRGTVERWATVCERAGGARPYVVKCDTFLDDRDPALFGADAACEFPPHGASRLAYSHHHDAPIAHDRISYDALALASVERAPVPWTRYPTVAPGWDNTPRRGDGGALVLEGPTPSSYQRWLVGASRRIASEVDDPIVFINAWNEWAEGATLEPDLGNGHQYLAATLEARRIVAPGFEPPAPLDTRTSPSPTDLAELCATYEELLRQTEAESSSKFEAGQEALRGAVHEREDEVATLRAETRRLRAWGDALDQALRDERHSERVVALTAESARLRRRVELLSQWSPWWRMQRAVEGSPKLLALTRRTSAAARRLLGRLR